MQTVILDRSDFGSELHENMFDAICEQFNIDPKETDRIELQVSHAETGD